MTKWRTAGYQNVQLHQKVQSDKRRGSVDTRHTSKMFPGTLIGIHLRIRWRLVALMGPHEGRECRHFRPSFQQFLFSCVSNPTSEVDV